MDMRVVTATEEHAMSGELSWKAFKSMDVSQDSWDSKT